MGLSTALYAALVRSGSAALLRRRNAAPIFCFHNVVPATLANRHGDTSLHLAAPAFADIVERIARRFTVIPLGELVRRLSTGQRVHGAASLTFDDAYRGAIRHAFPLLRERGLPATVFIVSRAAEHPRPFWWDRAGSIDPAHRAHYLVDLAGDADRIPVGSEETPDDCLPADWNALRGALDDVIEPGSHTVSHRNLSALDAISLGTELRASREQISAAAGRPVDIISYPYGFATREVVAAARRDGYRAGVTLGFGPAHRGHHPHALPRINVPANITANAVEMWACGIRLRSAPIRLAADRQETIPSGKAQ